jgi:hypothetical protein
MTQTQISEHGRKIPNLTHFKVWKTIKLGTCKTPHEYIKALRKADCRLVLGAKNLLQRIPYTLEEVEIDLVVLSASELGLTNGGTFAEIYARALGHGLELCPAEVGPALRISYHNQPHREYLLIAMEEVSWPAFDTCINTCGFEVSCSNFFSGLRKTKNTKDRFRRKLGADTRHSEFFWGAAFRKRYVFIRPRK